MGSTYLCVRRGTHGFEQRVCVKTILESFRGRQDHMDLFRKEAALAASLRHPGIASVLDVDDDQGYIVYEYIDGCDLRSLMSGARFEPPLLVYVLSEVCRALEYAHNRRLGGEASPVIHRDISPSNIMIDRWGNVKVIDFGIAKAIGEGQSRTIKGKLQYMSPEQAMAGDLDGRSDQYSVGVVAYEMVARVRPHDGVDERETHARVMMGEHTPITRVAPDIPAGLGEVIETMLAREPQDRFPTMGGVIDALAPFTPSLMAYRALAARVHSVNDPRTIAADADRYLAVPVQSASSPIAPQAAAFAPNSALGLSDRAVLERSPTVAAEYGTVDHSTPGPSIVSRSWTGSQAYDEPVSSNPFKSPKHNRLWLALPALLGVAAIGWFTLGSESPPPAAGPGTKAAAASQGMQQSSTSTANAATAQAAGPANGASLSTAKPGVQGASGAIQGAQGIQPGLPSDPNGQRVGSIMPSAQQRGVPPPIYVPPQPQPQPEKEEAPARVRKRGGSKRKTPKRARAERAAVREAPAANGKLRIGVFPSGNVWVDGKPRGKAPVTVDLSPGPHTIGAGRSSPTKKKSVTIKPYQDGSIVINLGG